LELLPRDDKGNAVFVEQFVTDVEKIYPRALKNRVLFLKAVKSLLKLNKLTVDNVWDFILHEENADKVMVINIPMGGKNP